MSYMTRPSKPKLRKINKNQRRYLGSIYIIMNYAMNQMKTSSYVQTIIFA